MSRRLGPRSPRSPMATGTVAPENETASNLFTQFCNANTFQAIMGTFNEMCDVLELKPADHTIFYRKLKHRLTSWKAKSLWAKLDKRSSHAEYKKGTAAKNCNVLIIGAGPCGLRMAIEIALLGGKAVIVEKRDRFSRNNVLHLWPYLIHDLKAFGAKKFFGKFCAGAIDHISIRTLQCILLKVALLVGVEVHPGVGFVSLVEPDVSGPEKLAWRAKVSPADHPVSEYEFDVLVGGDGKRNTLAGFKRKEFRGKLAIAITANFINRNTTAEASVEEISGVAFIFNQKFFKDLNARTGIDLENIVYYKDETHYFVMTAKKKSLLDKGVLERDFEDPAKLLARENVNQEALMAYAKEAADVSTNHMLPDLEFAHNHYGQPDIAMFDFTSMFAAEYATRVVERHGYKLLVTLVGDSLLEPFWPTGSGCARGFLGALDGAWMVRGWASGHMTPLEVMAERESVYQLLSQTTPMNISKHFHQYTIDPNTRYPNVNTQFFKPFQVAHQYDGTDKAYLEQIVQISRQSSNRYDYMRDSHLLLKWFQRQLECYRGTVKVTDLTTSWRNGLALSALIHKYRPELIDVYKLDPNQVAINNQKAFDIADKELGIRPVMNGEDMAMCEIPDKLTMVSYLSQFYEYFRKESVRPAKIARSPTEGLVIRVKQPRSRSPASKLALLNKLSQRIRARRPKSAPRITRSISIWTSSSSDESLYIGDSLDTPGILKRPRKPVHSHGHKKMREDIVPSSSFYANYKKLQEPCGGLSQLEQAKLLIKQNQIDAAIGVRGQNKVSMLAKDLARQFSGGPDDEKKEIPKQAKPMPIGTIASADNCFFCGEKVYLVERHTAEGLFFHRGCFRCNYCGSTLRLGAYAFQRTETGEGRFYCFQHAGLEAPARRARKRSFSDKELLEKLAPLLSPQKPPQLSPRDKEDRLVQPAAKLLSPPGGLEVVTTKKTPERIEYDIESEQEESELDQTTHNLNTSYLSHHSDQSSDSDSSSSELEWSDDDFSDPDDLRLTDLARNYSNKLKREYRKKLLRDDDDGFGAGDGYESDSDTPTIGASDADNETDTETEDYEQDEFGRSGRPPKLSSSAPADPWSLKAHMKSPTTQETKSKRLSFFDTVPEPVRLDPWSLQGFRRAPPPAAKVEEKPEIRIQEPEVTEEKKDSTKSSSGDSSDRNRKSRDAVAMAAASRAARKLMERTVELGGGASSSDEQEEAALKAGRMRASGAVGSESSSGSEDVLQESVHAEYSRLLQQEKVVPGQSADLMSNGWLDEEEQESESLVSDEEEISASERRRRKEARRDHMTRTDQVTSHREATRHSLADIVSIHDISSEDVNEFLVSPEKDKPNAVEPHEVHSKGAISSTPIRQTSETVTESSPARPELINRTSSLPDGKNIPKDIERPLLTAKEKLLGSLKSSEDSVSHSNKSQTLPRASTRDTTVDTPLKLPSVPTSPQKPSLSERGPSQPNAEFVKNKRSFFTSPAEPVRIDPKSVFGLSDNVSSSQNLNEKPRDFLGSDRTLGKSSENSSHSNISRKTKSASDASLDNEHETEAINDSNDSLDNEEDVMAYVKQYFKCHEILQQSVDLSEKSPSDDIDGNIGTTIEENDDLTNDPSEKGLSDDVANIETISGASNDMQDFGDQPEKTSPEREEIDSELDSTSALLTENLQVLENTQVENLSDLVQRNQDITLVQDTEKQTMQSDQDTTPVKANLEKSSLSDNKEIKSPTVTTNTTLRQPSPPRPRVLPLSVVNTTAKSADPFPQNDNYSEFDAEQTAEFAALGAVIKSPTSSEESEGTKFDTIKRRKVNTTSDASKNVQEVDNMNRSEKDKTVNKDANKVAPLANIDMDFLSDTDNELMHSEPEMEPEVTSSDAVTSQLSPGTRKLLEQAHALIHESEENVEKIKTDAIRLREQLAAPNGSKLEKRKSELERDAIARIDEMIASFDQSKETKIDSLETASNQLQGDEAIARWLSDNKATSPKQTNLSISSPILAGHCDIRTDRPVERDPSLQSPALEQVSAISSSANDTRSYGLKSPVLAGHTDITLDNSAKTRNDSSSLPYLSFASKDDSSQYASFGSPNDAFMGTPENRLDSILQATTSSPSNTPLRAPKTPTSPKSEPLKSPSPQNQNDSSIIEYSFEDEDGAEKSFSVDEKFVNPGRRRQKRHSGKTKDAGSDSSSFTISTPTGSVASTSSVAELNSTRASSALTPSTTGDSFAIAKEAGTPGETSNYSLDKLARLNSLGDDTSLSLEKVLEENMPQNITDSSDLSSIGLDNLTSKLRSDLEQKLPSGVRPRPEVTGGQTKTGLRNKDGSNQPPLRSVSAPASVHAQKKFPLKTVPLPVTCEKQNGGFGGGSLGSSRESTIVNSANTSKDEHSFYYTPNTSAVESMDTSDISHTAEPKSPGGRTTKSDSCLDDVRPSHRLDRLNSDNQSDTMSSGHSIMDAKRRFFSEAATPLRLDAKRMFADKKDSKSGPTAAVPNSNAVVGGNDLMYSSRSAPPPHEGQQSQQQQQNVFKKPVDVKPRISSTDNTPASSSTHANKSIAHELSTEEKRQLWKETQEQTRTEARERARMLSDEELGIASSSATPQAGALLRTKSEDSSKQSSVDARDLRPQSARIYSKQTSEESGAKASAGSPVKRSVSAAATSKDKKPGLRLFSSSQKSPKAERKQRLSANDEEKENKDRDSSTEKKDKRKSVFSMFRSSKSVDKKDKDRAKRESTASPTVNGEATPKHAGKDGEKEKKSSGGAIFRTKKSQAKALEKKQAEDEAKRRSLLNELVTPMYEHVVGTTPHTSAVKAKIETIAPAPSKAPHTNLEPPKATTSDFDTESEWDTQSVRSLQSSQVANVSEEELGKMMRKQQKAAKRRQREQQTRRLHMAQEIQRQLEEVEVKQRSIEQRGVTIERALRGEGPDAHKDEAELMQEWFNMVHEKNVLVRYEAELMVHARELELEDRHSRLEQQLRDRMSMSGDERVSDHGSEEAIMQELVEVVEQRDALVSLLEEDRQREKEQEKGLRNIMSARGYELSPISYANKMRLPSLGDIHSDC